MSYNFLYKTPKPFDDILLQSDGEQLTSLRFAGAESLSEYPVFTLGNELGIFWEAVQWLNAYFRGTTLGSAPKYTISSLTAFQREVLEVVKTIPFGTTCTYGSLAKTIALTRPSRRVSPQAVGQAVKSNPICLLVPCHRIVGAKGDLVGYNGGVGNKNALLRHERSVIADRSAK